MEALFIILVALAQAVSKVDEQLGCALLKVVDMMRTEWSGDKEEITYLQGRANDLRDRNDALYTQVRDLEGQLYNLRLATERPASKREQLLNDLSALWLISVPLAWMKEHKIICIKALRCAFPSTGLKEAKEEVEEKMEKGLHLFCSPLTAEQMLGAVRALTENSAANNADVTISKLPYNKPTDW